MLATDSLSLLFIGCFLFGLFFFIGAALLGQFHHGGIGHAGGHGVAHHMHVGDIHAQHAGAQAHGPQHVQAGTQGAGRDAPQTSAQISLFDIFNPTSIVLFVLGFGFFGYVFHNTTQLALPFSLVLAALGGLLVAFLLLLLLSKVFGNSEGSTIQDVSDRTGLLGKVSLTIPENDLGEILYLSPGGMRKSIPARSIDGRRLERDQEVVVVNYQRGVAEVDTWDHFVNQEELGISQSASSLDDLATLRALLEDSDHSNTEYALRNDVPKE
ncbi:MAG TPA: hypothetical protein VL485_08505 [Ktedonobacteraceae bacterium]|jgi:hypothetical protein|nr:hypothetical protein [Ktedonobacteraceae bacterium]